MMGYGGMMGGFGYGGFGLLWQIIWLVIIVAIIYALVSQLGKKDGDRVRGDRSLEILKERLAKGEIDYEEYKRMKEMLKV